MTNILFVDGTRNFSPTRLGNEPAGGIVTSLTLIPQYLAKKGMNVFVKSAHTEAVELNGVKYIHLDSTAPMPRFDVVVFNRNLINNFNYTQVVEIGATPIWWLHDIVDHRNMEDASFLKIQNIVSLSRYCTETYSDFYGIPRDRFTVIGNGVDKSVWYPGKYAHREKGYFVMASAPIKGFKPMPFTWEQMRRNRTKLRLEIYSSQSLHGLENSEQAQAWLTWMSDNGCVVKEPIPQKELADVFRKAWALLMPNDYPEICSNLMLQARACGLPVVTSPIGSAPEVIEDCVNGFITRWHPHDKFAWWKEFAQKTLETVTRPEIHEVVSEHAPKGIKSWDEIGEEWFAYVTRIQNKKNRKLVSLL